ncbi:HAD-IIB family hydrolase [Paenibacillus yanchengensis]|uniref:HAD-IIB family hydrolase n=1 Tax=Paenibacillus yanchengensis TaxID=2035833 RepID=A0ABW4YF38_9BACL
MTFVFDLDGTICFKGKPLSKQMVDALNLLVDKGHDIIFASARPIRDLLPILPPQMHHFPMVGGNGAFVVTEELHISTSHFDTTTGKDIIQLLKKYKAEYLVDSAWDYAYSGSEDHPIRKNLDPNQTAKNVPLEKLNEIVKVVILHSNDNEKLLHELNQLPIVTYLHGSEDIIDINPKDVSKWSGLQMIGIAPFDFIAFGNDANDIPMFKQAKRSICVGNHPELIHVSSEQVASDEQLVIQKIIEVMNDID